MAPVLLGNKFTSAEIKQSQMFHVDVLSNGPTHETMSSQDGVATLLNHALSHLKEASACTEFTKATCEKNQP